MSDNTLLRYTVGIPGESEMHYVDVVAATEVEAIAEYWKITNRMERPGVAMIMDVNEADYSTGDVDPEYYPG